MASFIAAVVLASGVIPTAFAQTPAASSITPLASQHFDFNNLPYQADPNDDNDRGRQYGYNICNSTTEGQKSNCQTAIINSLDDFCLWGPPDPDSSIGNVEGETVAWCTKPGHGTRIIPAGTLTGVQFMKTPAYVQVTGTIKQQNINIASGDDGGELDPHGADQRGNPLGGLLFSNSYNGNYVQAVEWHSFMGGQKFCLKACDPSNADAANFCQHIFDRIGCEYNAPAKYEEGTFESCQGDNQDFPGVYTSGGQVVTYQQPAESLGPISTLPYTPRIPASSNCVATPSSVLYAGAPAATNTQSVTRTTGGTTSHRATTTAHATSTGSSTGAASPRAKVVTSLSGLVAFALVAAVAL
jgi:hypothetical protein